ncbi:hypothetical protein LOTGIDRAFT_174028 [Lottia gigantea]|uniref:Uncharacterized protein n=1 Tax=Lottia gigantea TaxID=225164 RepID=V4A542_LOTGI|nr:hypothetical protein LOTGIDRAFT_174028 [Lottia gigantea]ESO99028.1 hypothetical protein LOTGIDRAFT_174028 [Lottia gigantea]
MADFGSFGSFESFEDMFGWDDRRNANGKATICLERNDKCQLGGNFSCCKGLSCQQSGIGSQRRCEISSSQVCVSPGQTCSKLPTSRKCCQFKRCETVMGRNICV